MNAPALTLAKHHNHEAVRRYSLHCFNQHHSENFFGTAAMHVVSDLISQLSGNAPNPIVIFQNLSDFPYIEHHVRPFLESFGLEWNGKSSFNGNVNIIAGEWGEGHCMPSNEILFSVLKHIDGVDTFNNFTHTSLPNIVTHVSLAQEAGMSVVTCRATGLDSEYAFYLLRGDDRLETQWYTDSDRFIVPNNLPAGEYRVHAFARRRCDGNVGALLSEPFILTQG